MGTLNRLKFWLGMFGAALLAAGLLVFVWAPGTQANSASLRAIQNRASELSGFARGTVKDAAWIEREDQRTTQLQEQLTQVQREIGRHYSDLRAHFDDPDTGEKGPLEYWRFRHVYPQKMQELAQKLNESVQTTTSRIVTIRDIGDYRPVGELHIFEREYRVLKALLDVIIEQNSTVMRVPILHGLSVQRSASPPLASMFGVHRDRDMFDIWQFSLEATLSARHVAGLLDGFNRSPHGIEVVELELERTRARVDVPADAGPDATPRAADMAGEFRRYLRQLQERRAADGHRPVRDWIRDVEPDPDPHRPAPEHVPVEEVSDDMVRLTLRGYVPDYQGR